MGLQQQDGCCTTMCMLHAFLHILHIQQHQMSHSLPTIDKRTERGRQGIVLDATHLGFLLLQHAQEGSARITPALQCASCQGQSEPGSAKNLQRAVGIRKRQQQCGLHTQQQHIMAARKAS